MLIMAKAKNNEVRVDQQGRVVIPAHIRRSMGIRSGEMLIAKVRDGQLVLEKRDQILARLKSTFSNVPGEISLADELIAERREQGMRNI